MVAYVIFSMTEAQQCVDNISLMDTMSPGFHTTNKFEHNNGVCHAIYVNFS
jgi:hypothetical protein